VFRVEDYEVALDLWKRVDGLEIAEGDDKESVRAFLDRNPGLSRVATDGTDVVVGVALCGHDGRRGHIYHLAIEPNYAGQGIGKRLVNECMAGFEKLGLQRAIILVADDNARGLAFWKRCCWEVIDGAIAMGKDVGRPD